MRAIQHKTNTRVLGAPKDWNQAVLPCNAIAVTDVLVEGQPAIMTFWKPSADELALLNSGGLVTLCTSGSNMPPVAIGVDHDYKL